MTTETTQQPAEAPEGVAAGAPDLSHLLAEVDQHQAEGEQERVAAEHKVALQQIDEARVQIRAALAMAKLAAKPKFSWWADFDACWSDAQLDAVADPLAQIMQLNGWSMGVLMERWGPYIALIVAAGGPALATYAAIQERREQLAKPRPPVMAPPPAPPSTAQEGVRL